MQQTTTNREQWLSARRALLQKEKELTRLQDEVSAQRRELPLIAVEKDYRFQTEEGEKTLADLFESSGLRPALSWIRDQADEDLAPSIQAFSEHLLARCKTSSDFAATPTAAYSPLNGSDPLHLPDWWLKLTLQAWERLLDTSDEKPQSGLSISRSGATCSRACLTRSTICSGVSTSGKRTSTQPNPTRKCSGN